VAPLAPAHARALLERAAGRQRDLGYREYRAWIDQVTPPDAE
jgi:hypothetical protein